MNTKGNGFLEALKEKTLVRRDKTTAKGVDLIKDKEFIVIYVGASFLAGSARRNVENLKKFYEIMKDEKLEIIYLSQDNNEKEFTKHFHENHGNWLAVPPGTEDNEELMKTLENPTIPHVIVYNKLGFMCRRTTGTADLEKKEILDKWRAKNQNVQFRRGKSGDRQVSSQESQSKESDAVAKDKSGKK
ncbi:unnamed protein product, partial [Mesorhabditis belari]|uniref:Thioredoxin-like fold domain-containing protein n=1 Tax=Mesorhabditis belari TaxID=2138241 RepID=A0AAF3ET88_9BILA